MSCAFYFILGIINDRASRRQIEETRTVNDDVDGMTIILMMIKVVWISIASAYQWLYIRYFWRAVQGKCLKDVLNCVYIR